MLECFKELCACFVLHMALRHRRRHRHLCCWFFFYKQLLLLSVLSVFLRCADFDSTLLQFSTILFICYFFCCLFILFCSFFFFLILLCYLFSFFSPLFLPLWPFWFTFLLSILFVHRVSKNITFHTSSHFFFSSSYFDMRMHWDDALIVSNDGII